MLDKIKFSDYSKYDFNEIGLKFLYLGCFLLPTAPFLAGIIIIISLAFSRNNNPIKFLKEKNNKVFILISLLMIFSCIYNYFDTTNLINKKIGNLTWISLINWIPFFWCFWGFQPYLEKLKERKKVARFLMMARDRRRMIPDKKKYNKKKERQQKYDMHDTRRRNNTQGED